jgi:Na+-driven multidrug efflux pump
MIALSAIVPALYGATAGVCEIATFMLIVSGISMPFICYSHATYYTLRTGGRVLITVLLDAGWMWAVVVSTTWTLASFTSISIDSLYVFGTLAEALKVVFCSVLLRKVNWAQRLVGKDSKDKAEITA